MKRFMLTVVLTCTLSISALAGEMPTCGPLSATSCFATTPSPAPGEMPTIPGAVSEPTEIPETDLLTTILLTLITWPR